MKVNLHILEACNYRCRHCFAHFNEFSSLKLEQWKQLVDNCIDSGMVDCFNIAGGEPLLYPQTKELAEYIVRRNAKCSIITNGSMITDEWISENAKLYETIGFSIDSFQSKTNKKLGRVNLRNISISFERLKEMCEAIKEQNPNCYLKVNTVVSSINKNENLARYIKLLPVCRYKILKMLEYEDDKFSNFSIKITQQEFDDFLQENLSEFGISYKSPSSDIFSYQLNDRKIVVERTTKSSYFIVSPNGLLLDNSRNEYVANLLFEDFETAIQKLPFSKESYEARYF